MIMMETVYSYNSRLVIVNAGYTGMVARVTEVVRINHDGEVNK